MNNAQQFSSSDAHKMQKEDFSFLTTTAIYLDLLDYIFSPQSFNDFYWKTENWKSYDFDPINPFGD